MALAQYTPNDGVALAFVVDSLTTRSAMERHVEVEDEMFLPKGCKRFIGLVGNGERVFRGSPSVEEGLVILRKVCFIYLCKVVRKVNMKDPHLPWLRSIMLMVIS